MITPEQIDIAISNSRAFFAKVADDEIQSLFSGGNFLNGVVSQLYLVLEAIEYRVSLEDYGDTTQQLYSRLIYYTGSVSTSLSGNMFWGDTVKDGLEDAPILNSDILGLANSALATERNLTLVNFGGGNKYLIFVFPTAFGAPTFTVNGLVNTAFTKTDSARTFINGSGDSLIVDIWVSIYAYNSSLASVIIS